MSDNEHVWENSRAEVWKLTATGAKCIEQVGPRTQGKTEILESEDIEPARDLVQELSAENPRDHYLLLVVKYNERFEGRHADFLQRETRYGLWKDGRSYFEGAFDPPAHEGCYRELLYFPEIPTNGRAKATEIFRARSDHPREDVTWKRYKRSGDQLVARRDDVSLDPDDVVEDLGRESVAVRTYTHIRGSELEFCELNVYVDGAQHCVLSEGNEY